jgi:uncharacterized protein (TIGR02246 family)
MSRNIARIGAPRSPVLRAALMSILVALPNVTAHAQSADDSAAVRALIVRYAEALRNRDAATIRADYAPNAIWTDAFGVVRAGPDSIFEITARQYADSGYVRSFMTRSGPERILFIRPDVALVERYSRVELQRIADGTVVPIRDIVSTLLLSKEDGRWLIQRESNLELRLPVPVPTGAFAPFPGAISETDVDEKVTQRCAPPVFPSSLRATRISGSVTLRYVVGVDGRAEPANIRVVNSTDKGLEQAAIDAVVACTGTPARIKGAAVRQELMQVWRFQPQ